MKEGKVEWGYDGHQTPDRKPCRFESCSLALPFKRRKNMTNYTPVTESMSRLLVKDDTSPSEWRVVGYLLIRNGMIAYLKNPNTKITTGNPLVFNIDFATFDPSILMPDGTWWFTGDRIKMHSYDTLGHREHIIGFIGILVYENCNWIVQEEDVEYTEEGSGIYLQSGGANSFKPERIGTVHDKEEE